MVFPLQPLVEKTIPGVETHRLSDKENVPDTIVSKKR